MNATPQVMVSPATTTMLKTPGEETRSLQSLLPPLPDGHCRFYLLRHGQTDWNLRGLMQGGGFDIELNECGKLQARAVARELASFPLDVIASSHLKRSHQTAHQVMLLQQENNIGQCCCHEVVIQKREFGEMRFGDFEGNPIRGPEATPETKERFRTMSRTIHANPEMCFPGGGESLAQVEARSRAGIDDILQQFPHAKHIAIVAHGRHNKVLLASLLHQDVTESANIIQDNTCINVLDLDKASSGEKETNSPWKGQVLNFVDHMQSIK